MRRRIGFLAAVFLVPRLSGQPMPPPQEAILERGPHHQVIQSTRWVLDAKGAVAARVSTYTQLETGLNYWDQGQWRAAVEQIELYAGGAVARQGQQAVIFARNLLAPEGTIDLGTVDGVRLRSRPLGLAYYDPVSGQDTIIATVKESLGEVVPPNQVVYPDAFDTVSGSIIYTWRKRGLSQDVVLWEAPPPPERWGLPSETARLEVLTEFLEAPAPVKRIEPVWAVTDPDLRARMAEPDGVDEELDFGTFRISRGRAFAFGSAGAVELAGAPIVAKRWMILETPEGPARTVLFESVDYGSLMPVLERLPGFEPPASGMASRASFSNRLAARAGLLAVAQPKAERRAPVVVGRRETERAIQVARGPVGRGRGLTLDYETQGTAMNVTLEAGQTYLIIGYAGLWGTTILEGAVVKFATNGYIGILDPMVCKTTAVQPLILTARDDDSVGEIIAGSTGQPQGYYGLYSLWLNNGAGTTNVIEHVRSSHGTCGICFSAGGMSVLRHAQLVECEYGVAFYGPARMENVRMRGGKAV